MNYLPEVKAHFDKVVEAVWDTLDPAIEFMAPGGSTVTRDTPRLDTKAIFDRTNKMPLRGTRRVQSYASLLYCIFHPFSVKAFVEEDIQRFANEQLANARLNVPNAMELLAEHACLADRILREAADTEARSDHSLSESEKEEANKENMAASTKTPASTRPSADELAMAQSYAEFMRDLLGDDRVDASPSFVELLADAEVQAILQEHLQERYHKTAEKYLAVFPNNEEEFEATFGDESSPWHQAAKQIRRNVEAIYEAAEEERRKVPKIRFDNFNIRDARRTPSWLAR
jgi:hypothetical protein